MNRIPIFDSLAHPTLTGKWLNSKHDASFELLARQAKASGVIGSCAIGMADIEAYDHQTYLNRCIQFEGLFPVAGFNPRTCSNIDEELELIYALGFRAIKIHPRFSGITHNLAELDATFTVAAKLGLVIFYCTYMHGTVDLMPPVDSLQVLIGVLRRSPSVRVVLVHGGDVRLLQYAELVRFNPDLLLDLSMTICKYQGSSLDLDIRFLFEKFDRRICIGTDFPEYTPQDLRTRFEHFSCDISEEKIRNIGYRNLRVFLGLPGELS